jgi:4'-phosphopantetheinyl transferase
MDSPDIHPPVLSDWQPDGDWSPMDLHEIRVLRVDLSSRGSPDDDLPALPEWHCLSEDERARGLRFVRPRDRRRFVICRGSLRMILGRLLTMNPDRVMFQSGPGGKPELASGEDHVVPRPPRFNVTHSDDLALIAISLDRELGADIERERTISEADRIVESYFTEAEKRQYDGLDRPAQAAAFLRGWTRKEAILKARGVGLAGLASQFETMFGTRPLDRGFALASPLPRVLEWWLWEAAPRDSYVAALAVEGSPESHWPLPRGGSTSDLSLRGRTVDP